MAGGGVPGHCTAWMRCSLSRPRSARGASAGRRNRGSPFLALHSPGRIHHRRISCGAEKADSRLDGPCVGRAAWKVATAQGCYGVPAAKPDRVGRHSLGGVPRTHTNGRAGRRGEGGWAPAARSERAGGGWVAGRKGAGKRGRTRAERGQGREGPPVGVMLVDGGGSPSSFAPSALGVVCTCGCASCGSFLPFLFLDKHF